MAFNKWLGAPNENDIVIGKYNYHRMWVLNGSAAAPLTPVEIRGIQSVTPNAIAPGNTKEFMHQGGGDDKFIFESDFSYEVTVNLLPGKVHEFIAAMYNRTLGATDGYALTTRTHTYPLIVLESVCRKKDGTHLFSEVFQDLVLKSWTIGQPLEDGTVDVTFYSQHDSFVLNSNAEIVVDQFTGDGSTSTFTLSATPLNLLTASNPENEDWTLDNMVYVAKKASGDNTHTRIKSGVTVTGTSLDVSGDGTPASGTIITAVYAKSVA